MKVQLSPKAQSELRGIWFYNAERHGASHADGYEAFLFDGIARLAGDHRAGREIHGYAGLRRMTLRRGRGDGHVVVYEADEAMQIVQVLHVFHTKQDIEGRLIREG